MMADVPTIDLSPYLTGDAEGKCRVAREIDAASRASGFFYATGHGIDLATLESVTSGFHRAMSEAEKWDIAINAYNAANPRSRNGYYMAVAGKKANESYCYLNPSFTPEHRCIRNALPMHEVNVWPDPSRHGGLREFYERYYRDVFDFSAVLLRAFAVALGKPEDLFEGHFVADDTLSAVSLIRYPYLDDYPPVKVAMDGTKLSFEHHQDVSLITVLYQTPVPNLQVAVEGEFQDIRPCGDAFLVNCGTYMAHLTNDYYRAPVHRVKFVNAERLSIPFFANLSYESAPAPFVPHAEPRESANRALPYGHYLQHGLRALIVANGQT